MLGDPERFYREVALSYEGDECLTWPYCVSASGYAMLRSAGTTEVVSRRVCEEVNGPPPTPQHEAAHSCGKGNLGCVTKRHLSWKTPLENTADKFIHGTVLKGERNGNAKLTDDEARELLALKGKMSQREIAARFSVGQATVSRIHNRKNWVCLTEDAHPKRAGALSTT